VVSALASSPSRTTTGRCLCHDAAGSAAPFFLVFVFVYDMPLPCGPRHSSRFDSPAQCASLPCRLEDASHCLGFPASQIDRTLSLTKYTGRGSSYGRRVHTSRVASSRVNDNLRRSFIRSRLHDKGFLSTRGCIRSLRVTLMGKLLRRGTLTPTALPRCFPPCFDLRPSFYGARPRS